jgi:hypothetical protein
MPTQNEIDTKLTIQHVSILEVASASRDVEFCYKKENENAPWRCRNTNLKSKSWDMGFHSLTDIGRFNFNEFCRTKGSGSINIKDKPMHFHNKENPRDWRQYLHFKFKTSIFK